MNATDRIRVVHVIPSLECGGAENQARLLLNGLDPKGFERHLVTMRDSDTANKRALCPQIIHHNLHLRRKGQPAWILRMAHLLRRLQPDVVQSHMYAANLYCALAVGLARTGVLITTEHGKTPWKTRRQHWLERNVISRVAARRIAVSADLKKERVAAGDAYGRKITVIRNCVEIPAHTGRREDDGVLRIAAVGRMVPAKDYPTLLRALRHLSRWDVNYHLTFIGDGPEADRLKELTRTMEIDERVRFAGFQSFVAGLLPDFDLFAMSSVTEGLPVALLEAMAAGLPVVCTRVGGIPEVVRHEDNGLLVEPREPLALAVAIERLGRDPELRARLGERARHTAVRDHSVESVCAGYEQLYRALMATRQIIGGHHTSISQGEPA